MAKAAPKAGRVLSGRYRLEERLGEGGMGSIWRAEHLVLGAPVAVKLIDRDVTRDEEALARFNREAQSAATLRSPHVVQIIDYGIDDDTPFMVMELLEGETLAERLRRIKRLSPAETSRIITHVARAISRAHEGGVVHRDLKPENVFLVANEDAEIAKVLDFGVAKVESATLGPGGTRTRTGSLLGTPFYMSPEQAQGNKEVDYRTDLWALGVIAFECLTGKRPFESDGLGDLVLSICVRPMPTPSEVGPVPAGFDEWFARACSREPTNRYQSAREMAEALRDMVSDETREMQITVSEEDDEWGAVPVLPSVLGDAGEADTERDIKIHEADTVAVEPERKPAMTVQQFGTSTTSEVPEPSRRTPLIIGVAALALLTGITGGVVFFSEKESPATRELPAPLPSPTPTKASPASTLRAPKAAPSASAVVEEESDAGAKEAGKATDSAAVAEAKRDAGGQPARSDGGLSEAAKKAAAVMLDRDGSAPIKVVGGDR
ncbi:MAG: serine/threonine protein kinase [Myxococcales bacterium]|nr:serine/threonine protein kinase [Myxococcales bacterium]MCB9582340.1 serine/threonine protein kinase [Polyangiaceae bacterium]